MIYVLSLTHPLSVDFKILPASSDGFVKIKNMNLPIPKRVLYGLNYNKLHQLNGIRQIIKKLVIYAKSGAEFEFCSGIY